MIKFENTEVMGWMNAIRGMRNPLNSWNKSDTHICDGEDCSFVDCFDEPVQCDNGKLGFCLGANDFDLMKRLRNAGTDHRKFMRMIVVYVDITAPLYWWKEFDTYKVGTVANSCSTMHKIHSKEFTLDDFSYEHLNAKNIQRLQAQILALNEDKEEYLVTKDKEDWWQLIQMLPSSYNQKRTVMMNYEVLANIYKSRRNHKLDEWSIGFVTWIESLPYATELIIGKND